MDDIINKTSSLLCADLDDLIADETSALKEYELTLLAKIISSKQPNPKAVQSILQKAWNPARGMKMQFHQHNIYSITFSHEWDRNRILASRPWSVMSSHVVVRDWPPHLNLEEIDFSKSTFWIRVLGLPPNMMTKQNAEKIGSKIGRVSEIDFTSDGNLAWLRFLRIQVQLDINRPLITGFYKNKTPNLASWIRVQYERLPDFCFSCGRLGHTNRDCSHLPVEPPENKLSPYGPWLRAESLDTCPSSATWNPLAIAIPTKPTSRISDLPALSFSDLPACSSPDFPGDMFGNHQSPTALTPTPFEHPIDKIQQPSTEIRDGVLPAQTISDLPASSLPKFPGVSLGTHPPPTALTTTPFDHPFDKTQHPRTEARDGVSNQTPPFFPHFKALKSDEINQSLNGEEFI
ncbi:hypothetical protein RJ640_023817 [Escallonia rubra]|uniref:CCHC-type domain-containing protein n=1 Tax=Escallonia rubra TaxID=112253 RepID=A0AA88RWV7_9ASTE|nr:hypothetical protein RJ640_023817 [Escallonia rubra]